jgi:hypothetical protein
VSLPIITADQRLAEPRGIKGVIFGRSGIGKTSLLWTLNASTTLFLDLEAGDLAVEGLEIDTLRPRTWKECRDFAVFIGGPNPALREDQPYSQAHFDEVCGRYGDPAVIGKYETVFIDSITVAGRLCFQWCRGQPEALLGEDRQARHPRRLIRTPADQFAATWLGHQWKPAWPRMRSRSLARATQRSATTASSSARLSKCRLTMGSSTWTQRVSAG